MNDIDLEEKLLEAIKTLGSEARLREIAICCNPNFFRGSDKDVRERLIPILDRLIKEKKIKKSRHNKPIFSIKNTYGT